MKSSFRRLLTITVLLVLLVTLVPAQAVLATDPTTAIHIVKLGPDGATVIQERDITYQTMKATLPVQGDGTTHYWTQGPTFDDKNWWDPAETVNLYDKGALQGTDVKDLCDLVGGMQSGDLVKISSPDGYGNDKFPYANVYNPDPRQGKMVISWYNGDTGYVPAFSNGMLLTFMTTVANAGGKLVFGHEDMRVCLPESNWHWNEGFPSAHGLWVKYVGYITIYTTAAPDWSLDLYGARSQEITQAEFENAQGVNCHGSATYSDASGTWSGIPLWMLTAYVDDNTILHGEGSYNDILAAAGYAVKVIGTDGSYTFSSPDIARNNSIILADKLNGAALPEDSYPLKLVGDGLTGDAQKIGKISRIELKNIPAIAQWNLKLSGQSDYTITQNLYNQCISCHGAGGQPWSYNDGADTWSGVPLWYFCGWVDDANKHGADSYNDDLAGDGHGYSIAVISADGSRTVLNSDDISRSSHYLLADKKNGEYLSGGEYPLALVVTEVESGQRVLAVSRVELVFSRAWDINGDHVCDIGDVVLLGKKWGDTGTAGWTDEDVNADGVIDILDVIILGRHWGETW